MFGLILLSLPVLGAELVVGDAVPAITANDQNGLPYTFTNGTQCLLIAMEMDSAKAANHKLANQGAGFLEKHGAVYLMDVHTMPAIARVFAFNTANGFTTTASLASATVPGSNARIINAVAHNLGAIPTRVRGVLRCATAENGFAIGDEVDFSAITAGNLTVMVNATTVTVLQTSLTINIGKNAATLGTPTAITVGSWTVAIYLNL